MFYNTLYINGLTPILESDKVINAECGTVSVLNTCLKFLNKH